MALTKATAQKLLRQIVGGSGFSTQQATWLGLSTTQPMPTETGTLPDGSGRTFSNYNINEPTTITIGGKTTSTSYARVELGTQYFANEGKESEDLNDYKVTIENTKEIHFPEALTDWTTETTKIKYFFIATSKPTAEKNIIYVGELADYVLATSKSITVDETYYNAHFAELYTYDADKVEYTQCKAGGYSASTNYYVKGDGIMITANTVPLIRTKYLKISVK